VSVRYPCRDLETREDGGVGGGQVRRGLSLEPFQELEVVPHIPAHAGRKM
jgi:hypothetical protein